MFRQGAIRRVCLSGIVLLTSLWVAAAVARPSPDANAEKLLEQAQGLETSNFAEFSAVLQKLNSDAITLSPDQQMRVRYLNAFQLAYRGDSKASVLLLDDVIERSSDPALRLRALSTQINVLTLSSRYEEAFTRLSQLLDLLPAVTQAKARQQAMGVASLLYTEAGQYDLALSYAAQMRDESPSEDNACRASYATILSLHTSGKFPTGDPEVAQAISGCVHVKEPIFAGFIRSFLASDEIEHGRAHQAIKLLQANLGSARDTHYPRLISEVNVVLAQAYWQTGDVDRAQQAALAAAATAIKNEYTEPLTLAYQVLSRIEKRRGNFAAALDYHEKYMAADKGYLDTVSAKALAYQTVKQQVLAKKLQIDTLAKQNKILQLQQALGKKAVEASRLWIILLVLLLGFIGFIAYRIKRSQLKFMKLARRDGLTGISNRQHFVSEAERLLQYCYRSNRDACLVLLDLDHFKLVNDTHGHAVGDRVLKRAVAACQAHLRSTDLFGRLGGEEFGMLLPECGPDQVLARVEQMRLAIAAVSTGESGRVVTVSASFGVASAAASGYELRQLMTDADDALYEAKREGRNRINLSVSRGAQLSLV
jgi:diguanylate cyclase (GGDEF)-like protein